jgi:hypothetical protein
MPKVRWTYRAEGEDDFCEEDILPKFADVRAIGMRLVDAWAAKGQKLQLVRDQVVDPGIHTHDFKVTESYTRAGGRLYYKCSRCKVTAKAYPGKKPERDPEFLGDEFEFCHEEMPKLRKPTFK